MLSDIALVTLAGLVLTQIGVVLLALGAVTWKGQPAEPGGWRDKSSAFGNGAVIVGAGIGIVSFAMALS